MTYFGWRRLRRRLESKKPFDDLPSPAPEHCHWLRGHPSVVTSNSVRSGFLSNVVRNSANEHGQIGLWTFTKPTLLLTSCDDANAVLRQEYQKAQVKLISKHGHMFMGKRNIILLQGREWKYHRAVVLKALSPATVDGNRATIADVANHAVESIRSRIKAGGDDGQCLRMEVVKLMKMITLDVFGRIAFSKDLECTSKLEPSPLAKAFDFLERELVRRIRSPLNPANFFYSIPTPANLEHARMRGLLRSFVADVLREKLKLQEVEGTKANGHKGGSASSSPSIDLLDGYLSALSGELEGKSFDETVRAATDALTVLIFAGYDTTSVALSYATYLVSQHPDVRDEMLREIDSLDSLDDPGKLKYCEAVIREALRLFPPAAGASRYLSKPLTLSGGYVAPVNTHVVVSIWLVHRDPKCFPRPEEFRPERWVRKADDGTTYVDREATDASYPDIPAANRKAFLPFSTGARSCAGSNLAMQEATIVLANLHKRLKFTALEGYVMEPSAGSIIAAPVGNLPMTIEERRQ